MYHVELVEIFENIEKCKTHTHTHTLKSSSIMPSIIAPINILVQFLLICFSIQTHIYILETGMLAFNTGLYHFPGA